MSEWKTYKLRDVVNILDYKRIPLSSRQREQRRGKYPYYGAQGIIDYINDYIFDGTYLLVAEDGENLRSKKQHIAQLVSGKYWVNNHAHILESNGLCDIRYICYLLNVFDISGYITGSAQPKLNQANLLAIEISLPPLAEQKRIADILSAIDDKIELNRRINANLEQQAQALYKSWFVDFEPFGGKMPEDWREGTLGEIMTITSGKHPKNRVSIKTKDVNIPIVGAADIIGYTNEMLYSTPILIIGRVGTHGIVQRFSTKCWPSDNTLVIQTKYYEMCYQLLKQIDYKKLNRGSTQPLITQTDIKGVEVIIPPIEILEEYENRVSILFHSINNYDIEKSSLSALRDTLLPKLMSGEIKV